MAKILIEDVVTNESEHLGTFWKVNSINFYTVLFNMNNLNLIQVCSLKMLYKFIIKGVQDIFIEKKNTNKFILKVMI